MMRMLNRIKISQIILHIDIQKRHHQTLNNATKSKATKNNSVENNCNFVTYDMSKDMLNQDIQYLIDAVLSLFITSFYANVMYEEELEFNKCFHHELIVLSLSIFTTNSTQDSFEKTITKIS
jgi:hypothetical protein